MSSEQGGNFRPKTPAELEDQILDVSSELGEYIAPDTIEGDIVKKDLSDIQKKFSARYKIYLETLRDKKTGREILPQEKARRTGVIRALNNLDRYLDTHAKDEKARTLRHRQVKVFSDLRNYLEEGGTEGYIKLPTGTGKTVIFSEFIEATKLKTLIVVPSTILIGQTEEKLQTFAQGLDIGKIYKDAKEHGHQVTIITYNSFVAGVENGTIKPEDFEMLILDEAHRALSEKRTEAVRKFQQHIKIGFSATPRFSDDKQLSDLLNTEIHGMSIKEAVNEGMLSPFSIIIANTETDISNVEVTNTGDYSEKDLAKAINVQSRNQAAVDLYTQEFKGETAVTYCCGVDHAKNLSDMFNASGVPAGVIYGKQPKKEQEKLVEQYESGEILVLCNADILIEGFDEPRASVCLNLRPTVSPVVAEQRGGRVLRLDPNNPNKFAKIVDFIDQNNNKKNTQVTFAQIAEAAYLNGVTASPGTTQKASMPLNPVSIKINGLDVIVDPEEVMRIVREIEEQKYKFAPEGWETYEALAQKTQKAEATLRRGIEKYRTQKPEWFKNYFNARKQVAEHLSPELSKIIIEQYQNIEAAPPKWRTVNALAAAIGKTFGTVRAVAENQREAHPEWFKKYFSVKKRVDEHYSPELCDHIVDILSKYAEAPSDWMTARAVAEKTNKADATIKKSAEKYRSTNPNWFVMYLNPRGRLFEYYSPELIKLIEVEQNSFEQAPEGWLLMHGIHEKTQKSEIQIRRILEKHRPEHPEWFKIYGNPNGGTKEYYAPELVKIVTDEFEKIKYPPEDWLNATQAARLANMGYRLFKLQIPKYVQENPQEAGFFQSTKTEPVEFYSPKIVELLMKDNEKKKKDAEERLAEQKAEKAAKAEKLLAISADSEDVIAAVKIESAPEGWKTSSVLRRELQRGDDAIKAALEKYREEHPEWFKIYKPSKGFAVEHYAPELVSLISKDLKTHESAPEGWFTINGIQIKRDQKNFKKIAEILGPYRTSNPELFKEYLDANKQIQEFIAPELVKIVEEELAKIEISSLIPPDWESSNSLVEKAGASQITIARAAEKYRTEHPEWFKDVIGKKITRTYYHPELSKLLITELKKYEAAPEGWRTANEILVQTGVKNFYGIKKAAEKYRAEHPEWFKMYKPPRGNAAEYYSPELAQLLIKEYTK